MAEPVGRTVGRTSCHHVWREIANVRGTWFWACGCGAQMNADGRVWLPPVPEGDGDA